MVVLTDDPLLFTLEDFDESLRIIQSPSSCYWESLHQNLVEGRFCLIS